MIRAQAEAGILTKSLPSYSLAANNPSYFKILNLEKQEKARVRCIFGTSYNVASQVVLSFKIFDNLSNKIIIRKEKFLLVKSLPYDIILGRYLNKKYKITRIFDNFFTEEEDELNRIRFEFLEHEVYARGKTTQVDPDSRPHPYGHSEQSDGDNDAISEPSTRSEEGVRRINKLKRIIIIFRKNDIIS